MTPSLNRRQMLLGTGAAACAVLAGDRRLAAAPPKAVVHETKVISWEPEFYHGWPTVAWRRAASCCSPIPGAARDMFARSAASS